MLLLICLINFSISSSGGRGVVIINLGKWLGSLFLQQNIGLTWDQSVNLSFPSRSSRKTRVLYLSRFDHDSLKKFKNAIFQISKLKTFNDFRRILTKIVIRIGKIKSPENRYQYICFRMWCPPPPLLKSTIIVIKWALMWLRNMCTIPCYYQATSQGQVNEWYNL